MTPSIDPARHPARGVDSLRALPQTAIAELGRELEAAARLGAPPEAVLPLADQLRAWLDDPAR